MIWPWIAGGLLLVTGFFLLEYLNRPRIGIICSQGDSGLGGKIERRLLVQSFELQDLERPFFLTINFDQDAKILRAFWWRDHDRNDEPEAKAGRPFRLTGKRFRGFATIAVDLELPQGSAWLSAELRMRSAHAAPSNTSDSVLSPPPGSAPSDSSLHWPVVATLWAPEGVRAVERRESRFVREPYLFVSAAIGQVAYWLLSYEAGNLKEGFTAEVVASAVAVLAISLGVGFLGLPKGLPVAVGNLKARWGK